MKGSCFLTAVPMRLEPSDRSEMVNQLLLGDTFDILEQQPDWSRIRCHYDGYEGWVDNKQWEPFSGGIVSEPTPQAISPSQVAQSYYMDAPYLWGGRTAMGIDCSGLTQVCFKACGLRLLRDASQQVTQGMPVASLAEAQQDDLCFFGSEPGHITHVGIYLGNGHIIHAHGQVRIDTLTPEGIVNDSPRGSLNRSGHQLTHQLRAIRRILP